MTSATAARPAHERVPVDPKELRARLAAGGRRTGADIWYRLYLVSLVAVPLVGTAAAVAPRAELSSLVAVHGPLASAAPLLVLAMLIGAARHATWSGIVVPDPGEVAWVLTAPIDRARWLRPKLVRAIALAAAAGACGGAVIAVGIRAFVPFSVVGLVAGSVVTGASAVVLASAVVWAVQCSRSASGFLLRTSSGLAVGCTVAAAALWTLSGAAEPAAVLPWSGPWGWVTLPLLSGVGAVSAPLWAVLALSMVSPVAAVLFVLARAGAAPYEELARRADPVAALRASAFLMDLRSAAAARRRAMRALLGAPRLRLPPPRRAGFAVPWAGALILARSPRWLLAGAVTGVAVHFAAASGWPALGVFGVGVAGAILVSVQVLDPLRVEQQDAFAARHLASSVTRLLAAQLASPMMAMMLSLLAGGQRSTPALRCGRIELHLRMKGRPCPPPVS